ncbi:putative aminotransferase-like, plant mobile domain-containing protein [Rosa chinensis]|uniref:Putative aminotransferase-like, plant mobile domain-containing protein n=2 Tax=Rosa chinensis TaxID=74649 RepID=A0A2P6QBY7_ROSCH|nr:putative aminotransferase-like, plant mobile domain-containing protein [Rosa chinensis]
MWRPYAMVIKNWNFPKYYVEKEEWVLVGAGLDDELLSFAMCLRVAELVGFDTIQQYLPHRVARQFGFDQDLPCSVSGHSQNYDNTKLYIPSRLSEADVSIRYLNWWKESVSGLKQRHIPLKKKVKRAVDLIYDASSPCICSPKNSEELVQVSAGRNEGEYSFCPPGFSLKRNRMEAGDPIDEDDLTISEALKLKKKLKIVETGKYTDSAKLSSPNQICASSSADESYMNIMKSKILEKEVVLSSEVVTWGSKGHWKLDKVIMSQEGSLSNDMVSIVGNKCPSSTSLSGKPECGSSMSLCKKRECASSSSLFVKQECTSSGSLFVKLECASISPSIADEGTFVNTKTSERLEEEVPFIKALIWGGKGKRKMKNVMRSKARSRSLFKKREDGSSSTSFEKRVSELKAKVYRLEKVVQVLKENTFGKS